MMMTRTVYNNLENERYQRPYVMQQWDQRNAALEFSYSERNHLRNAPTCRPDRMPAENEQDSHNGNSQTRRQRIAVACSRCRKRKIKCSGDPGNGLGCQNCRNAGSEACNFFRVGSYEPAIPNGQHQQQSVAGMNSYIPSHGLDRLNYVAVPSPAYVYSSRTYQHQPVPLSVSTRNISTADYGLQYDSDSPTESYGTQNTPLTPHDSYAGYSLHDSGRTSWAHVSTRNPTAYSTYGEQDNTGAYTDSQLSYAPTVVNRQQLRTSGSDSSFDVVSLQYSLPTTASSRVLPNPISNANAQSHFPVPSSINALSHRVNCLGTSHQNLPPAYPKPHGLWLSESASNVLNSSIPSVTSADLNASPSSKASTTASSSTSESSLLGYVATGRPDSSPSNAGASAYTSSLSSYNSASSTYSSTSASGSTRPMIRADSRHSLHTPTPASTYKHNHILPHRSSDANLIYTFSTDTPTRRNSAGGLLPPEGSSGKLVTGDDYTPIPDRQPDRSVNIRHEPLENHSATLQRTSMHAINQSS